MLLYLYSTYTMSDGSSDELEDKYEHLVRPDLQLPLTLIVRRRRHVTVQMQKCAVQPATVPLLPRTCYMCAVPRPF